jgi:hypothetical protein
MHASSYGTAFGTEEAVRSGCSLIANLPIHCGDWMGGPNPNPSNPQGSSFLGEYHQFQVLGILHTHLVTDDTLNGSAAKLDEFLISKDTQFLAQ